MIKVGSLRPWLAALVLLGLACASARVPPPAPAGNAIAPAPAPAAPSALTPEEVEAAAARSPEALAAAAEGKNCEAEPALRERAYCYLQSDAEASIDPLFSLGRAMVAHAKYPQSAWQDFTYAAENAGVLAAKTSDARLHEGLRSSNAVDHVFAVRALGHMLAILRMGYGLGGAADSARRELRLGPARRACLTTLSTDDDELLHAGGDCLKEIGDPADASALIDAALAHTSAQQAYLIEIVADIGRVSAKEARELVPILEQPLDEHWTHAQLFMRANICRVMYDQARNQAWAKRAAAIAVREIGNRQGQAREPCERLAGSK